MAKPKPCPFCGAMLIKDIAYENLAEPVDIYKHPFNDCILSMNTDEFEYIVPESMIESWNRRVRYGKTG